MANFQEFKKLKVGQKIHLLKLKYSEKQNVTITENDADKKLLYIDSEAISYTDIVFLDIIKTE
jgi:hypothetical protein